VTIAKVTTSPYFSGVGMTKEKAKEVVEKVKLSNVGNTKPPQWDGKKGDSYLMWKIKFLAHATMLGLEECFTSEFKDELPEKEKGTFDFDTSEGKAHAAAVKKNKNAMMQFALSFQKVAQLNKLNRATRANKDWPSGKAHDGRNGDGESS
jgi:hypothetical protein